MKGDESIGKLTAYSQQWITMFRIFTYEGGVPICRSRMTVNRKQIGRPLTEFDMGFYTRIIERFFCIG